MKAKKTSARSSTRSLTAIETSEFLEQLAAFYALPGVGNARVAAALKASAKIIARLGDEPMSRRAEKKPRNVEFFELSMHEFGNLSVGDVRSLVENPRVSKSQLIDMAYARFGMPRARLTKLPLEKALEAIKAAAANEESLEIIAENADQSGRDRQA